jgi:anti-sigma regulatory factor (Ser/Thr protein kinase)
VIERSLCVVSDAAELPSLTEFLQQFWQEAQLPPADAFPFELALEEVFMNVVMHGTQPGLPVPRVTLRLAFDAGEATLVMEDDGLAFDPLSLATPDVNAPIEDRPVGGLGVYLVRELMDEVTYQHTGTHNQLRMTKNLK